MLRGKDNSAPITNSCNAPYTQVVVDKNFDCFVCQCDGWLPIPVGQVLDFYSLEEVWRSPQAQQLQQDVDNKKFTWCAVDRCNIKNIDRVFAPTIRINIDESCNLACPSCRTAQKMIGPGEEFDSKLVAVQRILTWINEYPNLLEIVMSGNGDPLASPIIRPILKNFAPKQLHKIILFTNGLLMDKILPGLPIMSNLHSLQISVDAGSADVYHKVRRPGKWSDLMRNFDWIQSNDLHDRTLLLFVLQESNYQDLLPFAKLCRSRGFRGFVSPLDDWGTWTLPGEFARHNILDPAHPKHRECLDHVRTVQPFKNLNISSAILALDQ
jgi:organic radical activating enzyme